jgi:hypothetical protein
MARQHRSHSVAFKRQVAEEFLAGRGLSAAIAVREHPAPDRSSAAKAAATPGHEDRERMNDDNLTGEVRP